MSSRHFVFKLTSISVLCTFLFSNTVSFSGVQSATSFDFSKGAASFVRALAGKNAPATQRLLTDESAALAAARSELRISDAQFEAETREIDAWMKSDRFKDTQRLFTARQVREQRGSGTVGKIERYQMARDAAIGFYNHLRELFAKGEAMMTFGPFSPKQAVAMKQRGIRGIYLGGWATSAKGSKDEDPGPDLASYPLSQVPEEAEAIVRALDTEDKNQEFKIRRMKKADRAKFKSIDYSPWIIADADTGHGGDPHVRNLARRFVEKGVPGYHMEDQKPGVKKCGHQDGKVLVSIQEHIMRLNAMRNQLDVMGVPGLIVARTDSEAADFLDNNTDYRDHGFILGATNADLPEYKLVNLAILKRFYENGVKDINGHLMYSIPKSDYDKAEAWLASSGILSQVDEIIAAVDTSKIAEDDAEVALKAASKIMHEAWKKAAQLKTFGDAVADAMEASGKQFAMTADQFRAYTRTVSNEQARIKAKELLGHDIVWNWELPRTPEGYYQVQAGVEYSIHRSLQFAPYADILWMETKTANLEEARRYAEGIHAVYPDKMLAYNLSPSFNWDATGMSEEEMRNFGKELGKLGFVFNFITYAGHQIDYLKTEEFVVDYVANGPLALARVQRQLRLMNSPAATPQSHVGGPRVDASLQAAWGQTATTAAMGDKSTEKQHKKSVELSPSVLESWLKTWSEINGYPNPPLKVELGPTVPGQEELTLNVFDSKGDKIAFLVFQMAENREKVRTMWVKNQDTLEAWRNRRLTTLLHMFAALRFKADSIHYMSPNDANQNLAHRLQELGILTDVAQDTAGHILAAKFNAAKIKELTASAETVKAFLTKTDAKSELRSNHVPKEDKSARELGALQSELSGLLLIPEAQRSPEQLQRIEEIKADLPAVSQVVQKHNGGIPEVSVAEGQRSELRKSTLLGSSAQVAINGFGRAAANAQRILSSNQQALQTVANAISPKHVLNPGKVGFAVARSVAFDDALLLVLAELSRASGNPMVVVAPTEAEQKLVDQVNATLPDGRKIFAASSAEAAANILWAHGAEVTTYLTREELDAALLAKVYSEIVVLTQASIAQIKSGVAGLADVMQQAATAYAQIYQAA